MPGKMPKVGEVWRTHDGRFEATICDVLTHGSDGTSRIAIIYNMNGRSNWREVQEFRESFAPKRLSHDELKTEASILLDYTREISDEGDFGERLRKVLAQLADGNF